MLTNYKGPLEQSRLGHGANNGQKAKSLTLQKLLFTVIEVAFDTAFFRDGTTK